MAKEQHCSGQQYGVETEVCGREGFAAINVKIPFGKIWRIAEE